jgi:ABC-2 type transport system ATP-binding protein
LRASIIGPPEWAVDVIGPPLTLMMGHSGCPRIRRKEYSILVPRYERGHLSAVPSGAVPAAVQPAISVSGLVVRYGEVTAVDGIGLEAQPGQVLALLGRNGAGKTSAVEAMEGYRTQAEGRIEVLGLDPRRPDQHRRLTRRMGVMLQRGGVYPAMNPAEALHLFSRYYDDPVDPAELIERLDLGDVTGTPWRRLSGGEQQRLSLALALVGRPDVVFLDEPTAGVDPRGRLAIREEIAALRAAGVCVLLTTHELPEAERLADRIVIIEKGQVVAAGTPAELTAAGPGDVEKIHFGAPPGLDTAGLGIALKATVREESSGEYCVDATGTPALVASLTAWLAERDLPLTDLRVSRPRLEDVFLQLTASGSSPPATVQTTSGRAQRRRGRPR